MTNLLVEGLMVGAATGVVGFFISTLLMFVFSKDFSLKRYKFWPQVLVSYFLTGFILHIVFEYMGFNKKFCCMKDRFKC